MAGGRPRGAPVRVPSLAWLAASPSFRRLRRLAAGWLDEHFRLIEQGAAWLDPAGQQTEDFCVTSLQSRQFRFPRDPPSAHGHRLVRRVYAADGPLPDRLGELAHALAAAGWGQLVGGERTAELTDLAGQHPPAHNIFWRPVPGFGPPAGLELEPPARQFPSWRWLKIIIDWGPPLATEATGTRGTPRRPPRNTATFRWLERAATTAPALVPGGPAPTVAIEIDFMYYNNTNVNRRPGRLPVKRPFPVRRGGVRL
jgi:hypothetical protein